MEFDETYLKALAEDALEYADGDTRVATNALASVLANAAKGVDWDSLACDLIDQAQKDAAATPRPWRVDVLGPGGDAPAEYEIDGPNGALIATLNPKVPGIWKEEDKCIKSWIGTPYPGCGGDPGANAKLIVQAVNCHEELVAALELAQERFQQMGMDWLGKGPDPIEAALQKAKQYDHQCP